MGNSKQGCRAKQRKFHGNKHTNSKPKIPQSNSQPISDNINIEESTCPSAKKNKNPHQEQNETRSSKGGFILVDSGLLTDFFSSYIACPECEDRSVMCELFENRNGFAHEINVNCPKCDWKTTLKTSKTGSVNKHKEVNVRMVAFIRSLGKGTGPCKIFLPISTAHLQ